VVLSRPVPGWRWGVQAVDFLPLPRFGICPWLFWSNMWRPVFDFEQEFVIRRCCFGWHVGDIFAQVQDLGFFHGYSGLTVLIFNRRLRFTAAGLNGFARDNFVQMIFVVVCCSSGDRNFHWWGSLGRKEIGGLDGFFFSFLAVVAEQLDHKFRICAAVSGVFIGCGFMGDLQGTVRLCM
jgi:hypothetical protein